jgi:DNA-binding NtrC family response regulator
MKPKKVLVVDDSKLLHRMFEMMLRGFPLVHAYDGREALDRLAEHKDVELILLDINMPRMNGVEVLKDVKKIDESIAVIMVTANEQVSLAADALKSGAFGYVPKPFDFRYLDHMVASIFDGLGKR